jgi:hypothetical protein
LATIATGFLKGIQTMSEEMCEDCKYFEHKHGGHGDCHRYPPVVVVVDESIWVEENNFKEKSVLPKTSAGSFCGEWKAKVNKEGASS